MRPFSEFCLDYNVSTLHFLSSTLRQLKHEINAQGFFRQTRRMIEKSCRFSNEDNAGWRKKLQRISSLLDDAGYSPREECLRAVLPFGRLLGGYESLAHRLGNLQRLARAVARSVQAGNIGLLAAVHLDEPTVQLQAGHQCVRGLSLIHI